MQSALGLTGREVLQHSAISAQLISSEKNNSKKNHKLNVTFFFKAGNARRKGCLISLCTKNTRHSINPTSPAHWLQKRWNNVQQTGNTSIS
jgi:hypothetical protein